MQQEVKAKLRFLRIGPRKVRLVADLIRGRQVLESENILRVLNKKAARPILKLMLSAIANAEHNYEMKKEDLVITKITVDEGPILKRWMPRAQGRATSIRKRTSHINIYLLGEAPEKKKAVKKEKASEKKESVKKDKDPEKKEVVKKTTKKEDKK